MANGLFHSMPCKLNVVEAVAEQIYLDLASLIEEDSLGVAASELHCVILLIWGVSGNSQFARRASSIWSEG